MQSINFIIRSMIRAKIIHRHSNKKENQEKKNKIKQTKQEILFSHTKLNEKFEESTDIQGDVRDELSILPICLHRDRHVHRIRDLSSPCLSIDDFYKKIEKNVGPKKCKENKS